VLKTEPLIEGIMVDAIVRVAEKKVDFTNIMRMEAKRKILIARCLVEVDF